MGSSSSSHHSVLAFTTMRSAAWNKEQSTAMSCPASRRVSSLRGGQLGGVGLCSSKAVHLHMVEGGGKSARSRSMPGDPWGGGEPVRSPASSGRCVSGEPCKTHASWARGQGCQWHGHQVGHDPTSVLAKTKTHGKSRLDRTARLKGHCTVAALQHLNLPVGQALGEAA